MAKNTEHICPNKVDRKGTEKKARLKKNHVFYSSSALSHENQLKTNITTSGIIIVADMWKTGSHATADTVPLRCLTEACSKLIQIVRQT